MGLEIETVREEAAALETTKNFPHPYHGHPSFFVPD
jgi:hypothetical protein